MRNGDCEILEDCNSDNGNVDGNHDGSGNGVGKSNGYVDNSKSVFGRSPQLVVMGLILNCTKPVLLSPAGFCFENSSVELKDNFRSTYQKDEPGRHHVRRDKKGSPGGDNKEGGGQVHLDCKGYDTGVLCRDMLGYGGKNVRSWECRKLGMSGLGMSGEP